MTTMTTGTVTTVPGSVTTVPQAAVPTQRFPGSVTTVTTVTTATVPVPLVRTVPCPTGSDGNGSVPGGSVGNASWAVEVDRGSGWEPLTHGSAPIGVTTQATLDQLVEDLLRQASTRGYRYVVLRASAAMVNGDGDLVTAYRETALPLMHRPAA